MMNSVSTTERNRVPFTATQRQELEHQALVYKYMISGMPIPPDLLYTIKRSLESSLSPSKLLLHHQPQHSIGWNCFQMGFGRKIDPEPGRCRRTDGKKWRCSKEAYPDSKYCERHMHRGRNRSRKPVEVVNILSTPTTSPAPPLPPTAIPISKSPNYPHSLSSPYNNSSTIPFLYPHSSSPNFRPPGIGIGIGGNNLSSQDHFLLESSPYSSHSDKDYRYGHNGMKEEVDEHPFFSETSGSMNMKSCSMSGGDNDSWQLEPLTMSSSKQRTHCSDIENGGSSCLHLQSLGRRQQKQDHYYDELSFKTSERKDDEHTHNQKVMHHFFDEWPPTNKESSTTQLSISMPISSHDFVLIHNDK